MPIFSIKQCVGLMPSLPSIVDGLSSVIPLSLLVMSRSTSVVVGVHWFWSCDKGSRQTVGVRCHTSGRSVFEKF